jgi:hypothetical protein
MSEQVGLKGWEKAVIGGPVMILVGLAALTIVGPSLSALVDKDCLRAQVRATKMETGTATINIGKQQYDCPRSMLNFDESLVMVHYDPVYPSRCRAEDVLDRPNLGEVGGIIWLLMFVLVGSMLIGGGRWIWRVIVGPPSPPRRPPPRRPPPPGAPPYRPPPGPPPRRS